MYLKWICQPEEDWMLEWPMCPRENYGEKFYKPKWKWSKCNLLRQLFNHGIYKRKHQGAADKYRIVNNRFWPNVCIVCIGSVLYNLITLSFCQVLRPGPFPNSRRWSKLGWTSLVWTSHTAHVKYERLMSYKNIIDDHSNANYTLACVCVSSCPSVPRWNNQKHQRGRGDHNLWPSVLSVRRHCPGYEGSGNPHWTGQRGENVMKSLHLN